MKNTWPNWQDFSIYGSIIDLFTQIVGDLDIYLFVVYVMALLVASITWILLRRHACYFRPPAADRPLFSRKVCDLDIYLLFF